MSRSPWTVGSLAVLVYLLAWAPTAALVLTAQLGVLLAWPVTALIGAWANASYRLAIEVTRVDGYRIVVCRPSPRQESST